MRWSTENAMVAEALVAFQAKARNPMKDKSVTVTKKAGGQFSYSYAALPDILDQVRPLLEAEGLAVMQSVGSESEHVTVSTTVVHTSGEWMESDVLHLAAGSDPKDAGGAITYGRRYSLTATLGLAADDDDEAQRGDYGRYGASESDYIGGHGDDKPSPAPKTKEEILAERGTHDALGEELVTSEALNMLGAAAMAANMDAAKTLELATTQFGVARLYDLTTQQAGELVTTMQDMVDG